MKWEKDVGPRDLMLEPSGSELLSARHEILSSDKSVTPGPLTARDRGCGPVENKPRFADPPYQAVPARSEVRHVFALHALPRGVVARARVRARGNVVGEMSSYATARSCSE
jgi:hypothetical protein